MFVCLYITVLFLCYQLLFLALLCLYVTPNSCDVCLSIMCLFVHHYWYLHTCRREWWSFSWSEERTRRSSASNKNWPLVRTYMHHAAKGWGPVIKSLLYSIVFWLNILSLFQLTDLAEKDEILKYLEFVGGGKKLHKIPSAFISHPQLCPVTPSLFSNNPFGPPSPDYKRKLSFTPGRSRIYTIDMGEFARARERSRPKVLWVMFVCLFVDMLFVCSNVCVGLP